VISQRTILWFVLLLVFASGAVLRIDWEVATCREFMRQHMHQSSSAVASDESNTVTIPAAFLCQPGELEPWWAKLLILGTFVTFIGTIIRFVVDVRIWFRRARI
jgi:hypothetical protein